MKYRHGLASLYAGREAEVKVQGYIGYETCLKKKNRAKEKKAKKIMKLIIIY